MEHSAVLNGKRRRDSSRRVDTVEKGLVPKTGAVTSQSALAKEQPESIRKRAKESGEKDKDNHFGYHAALQSALKDGLGIKEARAVADNTMRSIIMTAMNKERKQLREKNVGVQAKFTADFN